MEKRKERQLNECKTDDEKLASAELDFSDASGGDLTLTSSEEDYLKGIKELSGSGRVSISELASHLNRKAPTVTEMVTRLSEKGLVHHKKYGHLSLTEEGEKLARKIRTRHDTITDFLKILGIEEKRAEADACQMEHVVHDKTLERIDKFVEFVEKSPAEPEWLDHFEDFLETGKHLKREHGSR